MNIQQVRTIARDRGIKSGSLGKRDLIRSIQIHEGNLDCFGRPDANHCDQPACLWREDCVPAEPKRNVV